MTSPVLRFLLLLSVVVVATPACSNPRSTADLDPAATSITYEFRDASVPPRHHRSFILTIEHGEARVVVDSYGDVLHDERQPVTMDQVAETLSRVDALGSGPSVGRCDGGTQRLLRIVDVSGDVVRRVSAHRCGGEGGEFARELEAAVAPLLSSFDMATLLAPG